MEGVAARERQGQRTDLVENVHDVEFGKTRDKVGTTVGMSGKTYEKAKAEVVGFVPLDKLGAISYNCDYRQLNLAG